jgi:predicted nucleic acid-binding protein
LRIISIIESTGYFGLLDRVIVAEALRHANENNKTFADAYIAASASRAKADFIATFNVSDFKNLETALYSW